MLLQIITQLDYLSLGAEQRAFSDDAELNAPFSTIYTPQKTLILLLSIYSQVT